MKKRYNIGYFFSQAAISTKRNSAMTVASVLVLIACLVIMGSFSLLIYTINHNLQNLYTADEIIVYLTEGNDLETVKTKIETEIGDEVTSITMVTKKEAYEKLKEEYKDHPEIFEPIGEDNPLPDTLYIKYRNGISSFEKLENYIENTLKEEKLIEEAWVSSYDVIEQVEALRDGIVKVFFWIWVLVFLVTVLVIVNTVRLSVHARADEIQVMRYIGASNWFITLPFVLETIYVALISTVIALPIQWYLYKYLLCGLMEGIPSVTLLPVSELAPFVIAGFLGLGILIGVFSSVITVKKYARK